MLAQVLVVSVKDLISMSLIVCIVLMAFASMGHKLFGPYVHSYKDITDTITTLSTNFLGSFDYDEISGSAGNAGRWFLLFYLITMIFIMINLFITLLCSFLDAVRSDTSVVPKDHEVADHFLSMVRGFIVPEEENDKTEIEDENIDTENEGDFAAAGKKTHQSRSKSMNSISSL